MSQQSFILSDGSNDATLINTTPTGTEYGLPVRIVGAAAGGTSSLFTSAFPSSGTAAGFTDGTNMQGARVFDLDSGAGTQYVLGTNLRFTSNGGSVEAGTASNPLRIDPTGTTTQPISGTVTANAGTGTFTVSGTVTANQGGTWTVQPGNTQNSTPWLVQDSADGPVTPGAVASKSMLIGGQYNSSLPNLTTGQQASLQVDSSGRLLVGSIASALPGGTNTIGIVGVPDKNSFTYGTTTQQVMGGVYQDASPTLTAGQSGALRLTSNRGLHVNLRDSSGNEKLAQQTMANSIPVVIASDQFDFQFSGDNRLRVGQETMLFFDNVDGTTVNTNIWIQSQSGMAQSQSGGNLILNSGNSLTSGNYSILTSSKQFLFLSEFPMYVQYRAKIIPQSNTVCEIGFGNAATNAAPTDGVFIRWSDTSTPIGVINFNGTETTVTLAATSSSNFHNFEVTIYEDHVSFECEAPDGTVVFDIDAPIPSSQGSPFSIGHIPTFARVYNSGTASSAAQIVVASCNVQQMDLVMGKTWQQQLVQLQRGAVTNPNTLAQTANYSNSAGPSTAVLSNTTPSYSTLGGQFQFAAVAGSETDYALFGFQVPTGYQLYVTNVLISMFITGNQSTTSSNLVQWGLGVNSSGASLATGGSNPPFRITIGMQQAPKTAGIGDTFNPGTISYTPQTPLVIDSGRYLHVIMKMILGNATASQIMRGHVLIEGYFE